MLIMNRGALIGLCKYILLFACFSKILVPVLGAVFCNFQVRSACVEIIELETEDNDCKGDISKKASIEEWLDCLYHFNFQKCVLICTLCEFTITNEVAIQCFYPDVLTPPPNV